VFGVRVLAALGCRVVLVTNAAGGIRDDLTAGSLMMIGDHLNLTGHNPLVGPEREGPRFPDMSEAYDPELRSLGRQAAEELSLDLKEGVYAGVLGPSYETPAEIRMLRALGADAVGMSTVAEVIELRSRGVRVGALSAITNRAAGLAGRPLRHEEVQETAAQMRRVFVEFLSRWALLVAREGLG
jgi:purine-nucleoside phosphorylase